MALLGLVVACPASSDASASPRASAPDACAGSLPTTADHERAFADVGAAGSGWLTADGFVPISLPDDRRAWLMSDTVISPSPSAPDGGLTFVHNSIVVQRGRCLTPVMGGTVERRDDLVPKAYDNVCWQSSGVARSDVLIVFCTNVVDAEGPPGFGFRVTGTSIASYSLPALTFSGRSLLPFVEPGGIRWGTGAVQEGDWVYVYGTTDDAEYVARVRFDRVTRGPWHFWTGTTWGPRAAIAPMRMGGGAPAMPAFVTRVDRGFVAVAFTDPFPAPTIGAWHARSPEGPWRRLGPVATAVTRPGQFAYDARAVDLGRAGWAIVYNVNDPVNNAEGSIAYGGRFVPAPRTITNVAERRSPR